MLVGKARAPPTTAPDLHGGHDLRGAAKLQILHVSLGIEAPVLQRKFCRHVGLGAEAGDAEGFAAQLLRAGDAWVDDEEGRGHRAPADHNLDGCAREVRGDLGPVADARTNWMSPCD